LEGLSAFLRSRPLENPPPGYWDSFWPRVSARLSTETSPLPRRAFRIPWAWNWPRALALGAAALALFIVGGRYIITGKRPGPSSPAILSARRSLPSSAAGVDYVIARADRPHPAPESHFVLARGHLRPAVPAFPAAPASHADHFILTSGSRGGAQPQVYW